MGKNKQINKKKEDPQSIMIIFGFIAGILWEFSAYFSLLFLFILIYYYNNSGIEVKDNSKENTVNRNLTKFILFLVIFSVIYFLIHLLFI